MQEPVKPKAPLLPIKPYKFIEIENKVPFAWDQELNLTQLRKLIPSGVKSSDIRFKTFEVVKDNDTSYFYLEASYYKKELNTKYKEQIKLYKEDMEEYKLSLKQYNLSLKQYELECLEYDIFIHKQELKSLEDKLKKTKVKIA